MIALSEFAKSIELGLNANDQGIKFAVFSDMATYKKALKSRTQKEKYTNGILRSGSSSITPVREVLVASQEVWLELVVQLPTEAQDRAIIDSHRKVLDDFFQNTRVQTYSIDGKTYTVSAVYSLPNTGTVEYRDGVGTSITFDVAVEYGYVENGLNSNDCVFTVDDLAVPFTSAKITKSPDTQADSYADSLGKGTSVNLSFTRSFDFVVPSLDTPLGKMFVNEVCGDGLNVPHTLKAVIGGKTYTYSVIFGQIDAAFEGVNNVGHTISFVERRV